MAIHGCLEWKTQRDVRNVLVHIGIKRDEMLRAHKIRLSPNNKQRTMLLKTCGCARLAYNWGLAEWRRQYENGERPNANSIDKKFNEVKKELYPFTSQVSSWATCKAIQELGDAFRNFFRRVRNKETPGYPKFKKKGLKESFYTPGGRVVINSNKIKLPRLTDIKMTQELRYIGRIISVVVSLRAGEWYAAVLVEIPDSENQVSGVAVGVDLGIKKLATLSDGTEFENCRSTKKFESKLRKENKALARKVKGSNNFNKQKLKLQKLHKKIQDVRLDSTHKMTSYIAYHYSDVCLEDLNVSGMVKNKKFAKSVLDASFYEIRRQLVYKCERVHFISTWFPSSKLCSQCGAINNMPLSKRVFKCDCGYGPVDRDLNAAQNILRQSLLNVKPVEFETPVILKQPESQTMKQERHLEPVT